MAKKQQNNSALIAQQEGLELIKKYKIFLPLLSEVTVKEDSDFSNVKNKQWQGWLFIEQGRISLHPKRRAKPEEWARLIAIGLVSMGFGEIKVNEQQSLWNICNFLLANRFCEDLKIGMLPEELIYQPPSIPSGGIEYLFYQLSNDQNTQNYLLSWYNHICGGVELYGLLYATAYRRPDWKRLLASGIALGVDNALAKVVGKIDEKGEAIPLTRGNKVKQQIISYYPLLGALAAGFEVVEDLQLCQLHDVSVVAIDVSAKKIWINPLQRLTEKELLFIFAHELLHAGLNHISRRRGRDPLLWNVACDFAINSWLISMGVGKPPEIGLLYDPKLELFSTEEIYDTLAKDIRRTRKLITMRGNNEPDLLGEENGSIFTNAEEYCRRALMQGLDNCLYNHKRGTIPAGLIEEIRSLSQPPIPWDVKLAQWFDAQFPPIEKRRTYARPSRRQSITPDIPRPSIMKPNEETSQSRVFGVLLDTSGSMSLNLLGKALGAISSYAISRDVYAIRVICCDAQAYDSGWVIPEMLLHSFSITGRGGTILQPGVSLLEDLCIKGSFPIQGPVLVITDGYCESNLRIEMTHAFLIPDGHSLPFRTNSEIFYLS